MIIKGYYCNDYNDALAISNLLAPRASQFLNMKNWDNSTNYSIPIARYFEKGG